MYKRTKEEWLKKIEEQLCFLEDFANDSQNNSNYIGNKHDNKQQEEYSVFCGVS